METEMIVFLLAVGTLVILLGIKLFSFISEKIEHSKHANVTSKLSNYRGIILLVLGILLTIIGIFVVGNSVGAIIAFFGIAGIFAGAIIQSGKNQEKREQLEREWERQYSNLQWRKENPDKARVIEEKRRREHMKQHGPAVSINNLQAGYFDHGTAYRASHWSPWANPAGGWSVRYKISNIGARTVKYVTITFAAYNAVGDKCYCRTHNRKDAICQFTGPLNAGCSTDWMLNENLWYDIAMSRVSVEHVYVEFMDGKSQDIYKDGKVENHGF